MTSSGLAELVGETEGFLQEYWRSRPAVLSPGAGPDGVLALEELDAALTAGVLHAPYVEMVRTDRIVPLGEYTRARTVNRVTRPGYADATGIRAQLDAGTTLVLRCVEQWHAGTAGFARRLGEELGRKVEAFFFVTPAGAQGLRLHRDDADVFVVQLNGAKQWYVHAGPEDAHWGPGPTPETGPPLLSPLLEAGQVLYIPRGFAHRATGDSGLSVHLSFTVRDIGVRDLERAARTLLLDRFPTDRRPLSDEGLSAAASELLGALAADLPGLTAEQLITTARQAQQAETSAQPSPRLRALARSLENEKA
ncbi:50S ribosomal protein L16 3-hydroxylase [Streptomyces xanthophaeus]|uniref:JmjC domain-containing protein n=1 Tax=Streptomyces xanthophaeus TaxID=67385 RepID=UPI00233E672C|nr:cupin domain-containing protein [Streptomyces xanthophaeus]WCD89438.1 50S ribosomal protein L16 3-hydroxylase [Streptomyces xanthophaeus]